MKKKLLPLFLAALLLTMFGGGLSAAERPEVVTETYTYIDPIYRDVIDEEDLTELTSFYAVPAPRYAASPSYSDIDSLGQYVREQMKLHVPETVVTYRASVPFGNFDMSAFFDDLGERVYAHTGVPTEGDYLRYQSYFGYQASGYYDSNVITLTFNFTYYTTAAQEDEMDRLVASLLNSLNLAGKNDYEKAKAIHDAICDYVSYDYANLNNNDYRLKYTAYAALANGSAVCQGYSVLYYRLLLEAGVDCRVVTGEGNGGGHAWNIVRIGCGGEYYNTDTTWDAGGWDDFYFLRGTDNFFDHEFDEEFTSAAFLKSYPMSASDFSDASGNIKNHTPVTVPAVPATCTSTGLGAGSRCAVCGEILSVGEVIPALGHAYKGTVTAPTCVDRGYTVYRCTRCGDSYTGNYKDPLGHAYKGTATAPTCVDRGYTVYRCTRCGESYTGNYKDPLGHRAVTDEAVAAGCETTGLSEGSHCAVCGEVLKEQETTPAAGHRWDGGKVTKAATLLATGEKVYTCAVCGATKKEVLPVLPLPFKDVAAGAYYEPSVRWAVANGVTSGTSADKFSPNDTCTRGQVVTFLWRSVNSPAPESRANPFNDVKPGAYYYDAVLWAVEQGITKGTSATTFDPGAGCTRGQVVTFLWRLKGEAEPAEAVSPFVDVAPKDYFRKAVLWAVANGVTNGVSADRFGPKENCTRAQVVTFLCRVAK